MNIKRAKDLLYRINLYAEGMIKEGNYVKKEVKAIKKELELK